MGIAVILNGVTVNDVTKEGAEEELDSVQGIIDTLEKQFHALAASPPMPRVYYNGDEWEWVEYVTARSGELLQELDHYYTRRNLLLRVIYAADGEWHNSI